MSERIEGMLRRVRAKEHHTHRQDIQWADMPWQDQALTLSERTTLRLCAVLGRERPVLYADERIALMRTVKALPPLFSTEEWAGIAADHFIHEQGVVCNICPDYAATIASGLARPREAAAARLADADRDMPEAVLYRCIIDSIDAVLGLCDRYAAAAQSQGLAEMAGILGRVPRHGAATFLEALQLLRILHFTLWCEGEYHNTIGRFDQYMLPYLQRDLDAGTLTPEEAYDLLLEFFITFNRDSDLYPGQQQGDNGQSLMLGGLTPDGRDGFNMLSEMCLRASLDLCLIDPKINLRVHSGTANAVYEQGARLTRAGLGFPQYSNDEVVIPGLTALGYREEDARDYTVAACWEFIIPGHGMDIPNIDALSLPAVIDSVLPAHADAPDFDALRGHVRDEIARRCDAMAARHRGLFLAPAPFMSLLMGGIQSGRDISLGARYNNYGIHGTGLSTAADSLAAIHRLVWLEGAMTLPDLAACVRDDFAGSPGLLARLRYEMPKMGQDDDEADENAVFLLGCFADALEGRVNERGGRYRPGTGAAMFYLWHAAEIGASPDGRRKGEPYSANLAPSLFAQTGGPLSIVASFVKPDYRRAINGGPLTLEFHEAMFAEADSIRKMAMFVRAFMDMGGHQLQLNTVNREALLDAQAHPEAHKGLIVRVWGWSAYFVELDRAFQDHVIRRQEYRG